MRKGEYGKTQAKHRDDHTAQEVANRTDHEALDHAGIVSRGRVETPGVNSLYE